MTNFDPSIFNDEFAYASAFTGKFSLLLSLVIGIIATVLVFRAAKKLGGGLFGSILNYIGIGMLLVVIGAMLSFASPFIPDFILNIASTATFALGYIFMVIGANKLFKGIMST